MKIISLGGGTVGIKRLKLSPGTSKSSFISRNENGAEIWNKLTGPSPRFGWEDEFGEFGWHSTELESDFNWQSE